MSVENAILLRILLRSSCIKAETGSGGYKNRQKSGGPYPGIISRNEYLNKIIALENFLRRYGGVAL